MKAICNRGALLEALNVVGQAVQARTPKPVLQCVKLTCADDRLTLAATDMETAVRYSDAQVQIETDGETLLPADKLRDIVRESMDDTLSIELKGEQCVIRGSDSRFTVYTQNPGDFPPVPDFEGDADFEINGGLLKRLIGKTLFAAAREGTRYAFNGVLTTLRDGRVMMVSTDGRRLAQAIGEVSSGRKKPAKGEKDGPRAIIPTKALQLVDKLVGDPEEMVRVQIRPNQVIFATAAATLTSNLVEGQFPPFEDVIPKDSDKKMTASCGDLMSAVRRASLLTTEESKGVRMHFTKDGLKLTSRSAEAGEAEVNFACRYEGADLEIGFNPQFLVDALKVTDTDEITFEMSAPNRPGLLRGGEDFIYVIMPVNLQ
jgi:DNA polymerase-3 subunit beta